MSSTSVAQLQDGKPTGIVNSCITSGCHTNIINQPVMHAPTAEAKCLECHEYAVPEEHLFVLNKPDKQLCIECHKPSHLDRVIHQPVAEGQCLSCHDPHGSEHITMLRKDPAKDLCMDCHDDDYSKHEFVHGPVAVGACIVCHDSHSSSFPALLIDRPDQLCFNCHDELKPSPMEARNLHKPMEDGCISCHNPHASDEKFQLNESVPNLCIECHDWFDEMFQESPVIHAPAQAKGGCTDCHNPHFSVLPKLQKQTQPDLCLSCHDKPMITSDGRTLIDMKTFLEENTNHHGPIRDGSCTMCHHPHASQEQNLLIQAYPKEFYAPFGIKQYQLCFTCHQSDLVMEESGTGLTRFRQGDQNLHWLHVNQEKGRTCRACHEVHASNRPAHIRESVPFGSIGWLLDINFEERTNGGFCAPACHKERTYDRTGITAPEKPAP
ncbi:MAG: cytochrome c3 family protein [Phycisphaerales bacterium]|nr:cytochrome c3 family protein [Phycisphaerales bacterium]